MTKRSTDPYNLENYKQPVKSMTTDIINTRIADALFTVFELLNEDTVEYIYGMLLKDPYDDNTRETVCGILMEDLLSQFDIDGTVLCDSFFRLVDIGKQ